MFLKLYLLNRVIIKIQRRVLWEKITSCAWLLGSGLKFIFHWLAQEFILHKSLFKLVADIFILSTTEKSEILFAKSLTFVVRPFERSLIQIKNNNEPRMDPCGPADSIFDHEDSWPFNTTLCFLSLKKSLRVLKRLPDIPFYFNLKIRHLCHSLSKVLDMSKNTDRTSWLLSKDL